MQFLRFPIGVRNIGMGATGTSDVSGLGTGYFNPATVAFTDATSLTGSYENIGAGDINLSDLVVSSPIPFRLAEESAWHFAGSLGYTRLGMDPQPERTIFLPEGTGETFDASDWAISGLAAASWSRGAVAFAGGATTKYLYSGLARSHADAWALDLGVIAAFPMDIGGGMARPRFGYSILNLDTGASFDGRDAVIANEQRGGFGFDMSTPPVAVWGMAVPLAALSLDYDRINRQANGDFKYAAGFELSIIELMHFRYGTVNNDYTTYGFGLGWDYGQVLFRMDYAHQNPEDNVLDQLDFDRDTVGALIGVRW
jgi:hypothetical protein